MTSGSETAADERPNRSRCGARSKAHGIRAIAFAAAISAAELALGASGLLPGSYARAEPFIFFELRPILLLPLALLLGGLPWGERLLSYGFFLVASCLAESIYLSQLGAPIAWPEMGRGSTASALLLLPMDLILVAARRRFGRSAFIAAAIILAFFCVTVTVSGSYRLLFAPEATPQAPVIRPRLLVMTALPIVWGEGGAFDPTSRPAAAYRALNQEFRLEPIDALDEGSLAGAQLLLLAQPRWLAPAELVAVDSWVRAGGRLLILTDPQLEWPSDLPLGDIRRPPPTALLKPLLDHWGVRLDKDPTGNGGLVGTRRLRLEAPGRFTVTGSVCLQPVRFLAECRIGKGQAFLIADADLMRDELWVAAGANGAGRKRRLADNPLFLADLLDRMAGLRRPRVLGPVNWAHPAAPRGPALALGLLTLVLAASLACGAVRLLPQRSKR